MRVTQQGLTLLTDGSSSVCEVFEAVEEVDDERRRRLLGRSTSRPTGKGDLVIACHMPERMLVHDVAQV